MKILSIFFILFSLNSVVFGQLKTNQDYIDWSETPLTFNYFKVNKLKTKDIKGDFSTKISWTISQYPGEVPQYKVYNKMNPSLSWMSMHHKELLKEYQFLFDLSELYTRKIRKEISELNQKKVIDKEVYKAVILKHISKLNKQKKKYDGVIYNQPDLYKILNTQYQDSLKIYKQYAL